MAQTLNSADMPHSVFNPKTNFTTINQYENHSDIKQAEQEAALRAAKEARIRAIENSEPEQKRVGGGGEFEEQKTAEDDRRGAWDGEGGFWSPPTTETHENKPAVDANFESRESAWDGEAGFWKNWIGSGMEGV